MLPVRVICRAFNSPKWHSNRMKFGNNTNCSANVCKDYPGDDLTVLMSLLPLPLVAAIIFNALMVVALILSTSVAVQVRVLLIHLLVATLVIAVIMLCATFYSVALVRRVSSEPSEHFCRFVLWVYSVTLQARVSGLVVFSMMVLRTVTQGTQQIRVKWLIVSLVASWIIATVFPIHILLPPMYEVQYFGCIACFPGPRAEGSNCTSFQVYYNAINLVIGYVAPLLFCFCLLLAIVQYIKQHTTSEGAEYKLAKFATFLITGSILNAVGQAVPVIVSFHQTNIAGVYLACIITVLSFFPTPSLIFVFLKPVRKWLCRLLCSKCRKGNRTISMQQAETQL